MLYKARERERDRQRERERERGRESRKQRQREEEGEGEREERAAHRYAAVLGRLHIREVPVHIRVRSQHVTYRRPVIRVPIDIRVSTLPIGIRVIRATIDIRVSDVLSVRVATKSGIHVQGMVQPGRGRHTGTCRVD